MWKALRKNLQTVLLGKSYNVVLWYLKRQRLSKVCVPPPKVHWGLVQEVGRLEGYMWPDDLECFFFFSEGRADGEAVPTSPSCPFSIFHLLYSFYTGISFSCLFLLQNPAPLILLLYRSRHYKCSLYIVDTSQRRKKGRIWRLASGCSCTPTEEVQRFYLYLWKTPFSLIHSKHLLTTLRSVPQLSFLGGQ